MEHLTPGVLDNTVKKGDRPTDVTVQVLQIKAVQEESNGNCVKYRLRLFDGFSDIGTAMFFKNEKSPANPPSQFSVIRICDKNLPAGASKGFVTKMPKKDTPTYAWIFSHFVVVKEGSDINRKLEGVWDINNVASPKASVPSPHTPESGSPFTPKVTSTPTAPPPLGASQSNPGPVDAGKRESVKRKIVEFFDPGEASTKVTKKVTHFVEALTPFTNKYWIKVRVSKMGSVKQIESARFQGKVLDCILGDKTGDIKLTAWNNDAEKMAEQLKNDKTYFLSGCTVLAITNRNYNSTNHNYELKWSPNTVVEGPVTVDPVQDKGTFADVIGFVSDSGSVQELRSRQGRDLTKREIIITDDSDGGTSLKCTLWNEQALQFNAEGKVIAIKGAKVDEWNGSKNISVSFNSSYEVEPQVDGVEKLKAWALQLTGGNQNHSLNSTTQSGSKEVADSRTIQEIKNIMAGVTEAKRFSLLARIVQIKKDNVVYRAHDPSDGSRCMKKVTEGNQPGTFKCEKCGKYSLHESETVHRYMMQACLGDATSTEWAVLFDSASRLTGMSANDLHQLRVSNVYRYEEVIDRILFSQLAFTVTAKIETWNDVSRVKFTVQDVKEIEYAADDLLQAEGVTVDWKEHARRLASEIGHIERELKESHEELYGFTWDDALGV